MTSKHWEEERANRNRLINEVIGLGKPIKEVIIIVYNARTGKMITRLIARVGQVKRYYEDGKAPKEIIRLARKHTDLGYNYY